LVSLTQVIPHQSFIDGEIVTSKNKTGPVFICGHPRSGSTALYRCLRTHDEFRNDTYHDKEFKFFKTLIQDRPWSKIPTVSDYRFNQNKSLDDSYLNMMVKRTHEFLAENIAGKNGRYLNAYPYDVDYMDMLWEGDRNSKFIILFREPYSNIWSMLNYKGADWARRSKPEEQDYNKDDIWQCALAWSIPIWSYAKVFDQPTGAACLLVKFEDLLAKPRETLLRIFDFINIEPDESVMSILLENQHHSSFAEDRKLTEKDTLDISRRKNLAMEHPEIRLACEDYLELTRGPRRKIGLEY
jgi:Sulfotransferase family